MYAAGVSAREAEPALLDCFPIKQNLYLDLLQFSLDPDFVPETSIFVIYGIGASAL